MTTPIMDLSMTRGDTVNFDVEITRGGYPMSLTGASVWFMVKALYTDADGAAKHWS